MSLNFTRAAWKNFLSTGNDWTEINLSDNRTTLIIGENGAGKSTILDAICYALYNKAFRKINKPQLINAVNQKNCVVEIGFSTGRDEYLIRRGMKPNIFEIEKNGELVNQDAANRDYQDILEKYILKMSYKSFCQVVILGSASFVPFMQLPTGQRREIIEDLLDIQIFTTMNMLLKDKINTNKSDILEVDYRIELTNEKVKMHEEHLKSLVENSTEIINDLKIKTGRLYKDIDNEEKIIEERSAQTNVSDETVTLLKAALFKRNEMHNLINKLDLKIERLDHDINFFGSHENCPTCQQIIDTSFRERSIAEKKLMLSTVIAGMDDLYLKVNDLQSAIDRHEESINRQKEANLDIKMRKEKIKSIQSNIDEIGVQIKRLEAKNVGLVGDNDKMKELETDMDRLTAEKSDLYELREIHKTSSIILKDEGIKSKIIKQYIPIINKLINKYLASMDFFVQFELDENFNESIKSRFRDEFSYSSFSEGEKAKIDLALLFAWRAIAKLRNSAATNIIILDEVFDGSLDSNSSDELLKILLEISNNSNIFVISHKTDVLLDKFDRIIRFEKRQNFSYIAE